MTNAKNENGSKPIEEGFIEIPKYDKDGNLIDYPRLIRFSGMTFTVQEWKDYCLKYGMDNLLDQEPDISLVVFKKV